MSSKTSLSKKKDKLTVTVAKDSSSKCWSLPGHKKEEVEEVPLHTSLCPTTVSTRAVTTVYGLWLGLLSG